MTADTTTSAAWPKDADVFAVRVTAGAMSIVVCYDEAHRYRRMIRRINGALP